MRKARGGGLGCWWSVAAGQCLTLAFLKAEWYWRTAAAAALCRLSGGHRAPESKKPAQWRAGEIYLFYFFEVKPSALFLISSFFRYENFSL